MLEKSAVEKRRQGIRTVPVGDGFSRVTAKAFVGKREQGVGLDAS
jgi:hypothetical protein